MSPAAATHDILSLFNFAIYYKFISAPPVVPPSWTCLSIDLALAFYSSLMWQLWHDLRHKKETESQVQATKYKSIRRFVRSCQESRCSQVYNSSSVRIIINIIYNIYLYCLIISALKYYKITKKIISIISPFRSYFISSSSCSIYMK